MPAAVLLVLQAIAGQERPRLTVGDTVWLEHSVAVPARVSVRPRPIASSILLEPLSAPQVVIGERGTLLRYAVVFWRPGIHLIEIPGPILVRSDGWSDTLAAAVTRVEIASVLPRGPADSIAPRRAEPALPRVDRSLLPALVFLALAGVSLLPVHFWWRRRGKPVPSSATAGDGLATHTLDAWLAAGEIRAALAGWTARVRATTEARNGTSDLLERLERARYGPIDPSGAATLAEEARAWLARKAAMPTAADSSSP
ncbi:MAG TPA: hypothetical protein VGA42_08795 [Gemmatimonadales bacterium]